MALKLKTVCVILLSLLSSSLISQTNDILISERSSVEVDGHLLHLEGIWMSDGIIRADVSVLETKNSKPMTGGYKKGDEIKINNSHEHKYYIKDIKKFGTDINGYVVLSTLKSDTPVSSFCDGMMMVYESYTFKYDSISFTFSKIIRDDSGKLTISVLKKSDNYIYEYLIKEGDVHWNGDCVYMLESIMLSNIDNSENKNAGQDNNPKVLLFRKLNNVFYSSNDFLIKGETLNAPVIRVDSSSFYIIRKMKLYKKKRPTDDEIKNETEKIYLLRVYSEKGNIARLVIEIEKNGKKMFLEFDAVRVFKDEDEALEFAKNNGIKDISFNADN